MNSLKRSLSGTLMGLIELLIGILLLIDPVGFTSGIIIAFGIVMMLWGLANIVKYFRTGAEEAAAKQLLATGLAKVLVGAFCAFRSHWFVATFPVLTLLYGVVILFVGLRKVQWTADMLRLKRKRWFLALISAAVSLLCGVVIITSPFSSTAVLWMFTAIGLIVDAVCDMIAAIWGGNEKEKESSAE